MATQKQQTSILTPGMDVDENKNGSFVKNFTKRENEWQVRAGMGLLYRGDSTLSNNSLRLHSVTSKSFQSSPLFYLQVSNRQQVEVM